VSMETSLVPALLERGVRAADIHIASADADGICLGPGRACGDDRTPAFDRPA
jgi:hypothetical protein